MTWQEDLAKQIEAVNERYPTPGPDDVFDLVARGLLASINHATQARLSNGVNANAFGGAAPGTLLRNGHEIRTMENGSLEHTCIYLYRPGLRWNFVPHPDGGYAEYRDADDQTLYPAVDFGRTLGGSRHDPPPLF